MSKMEGRGLGAEHIPPTQDIMKHTGDLVRTERHSGPPKLQSSDPAWPTPRVRNHD